MAILNGGIDQSFIDQFDLQFYATLRATGSAMLNGVTQEEVLGNTKIMRQFWVGPASYVDERGEDIQEAPTAYSKRILVPQLMRHTLSILRQDMIRQMIPDVGQLAMESANACGILLDQMVINGKNGRGGILGQAKSVNQDDSETWVSLPYTQFIPYRNTFFGNSQAAGAPTAINSVDLGLSVSKINQAVDLLRTDFNQGPIVLVGSSHALATLRADPRASNIDFSERKSLYDGFIDRPAWGVDAFLMCEQVPKNILRTYQRFAGGNYLDGPGQAQVAVAANSGSIEYVVVYSYPQIKLGSSMPFNMQNGEDVRKGFSQVIMYEGMYDCIRMQEQSVAVIEVATPNTTSPANP
ncbi:MAG: hypothetical protein LBJ80_00120 [Rickettsiales bacterium]|nr:hypothetical protein [Rickettsiales bacterium]